MAIVPHDLPINGGDRRESQKHPHRDRIVGALILISSLVALGLVSWLVSQAERQAPTEDRWHNWRQEFYEDALPY